MSEPEQSASTKAKREHNGLVRIDLNGRRLGILVVCLLLVAATLQVASASTLGNLTVKLVGTASGATDCSGTIGVTPTYAYRSAANQYEINNIALTNVAALCQGQKFSLTFAQGDSTGTEISTDTGTLTNGQGSSPHFSVTTADRPNLDLVNIVNNQIKYVLFIGDN